MPAQVYIVGRTGRKIYLKDSCIIFVVHVYLINSPQSKAITPLRQKGLPKEEENEKILLKKKYNKRKVFSGRLKAAIDNEF